LYVIYGNLEKKNNRFRYDIYLNIRVEPSNSDTLEEEIERKQEILVNDNIISQRNREINTMDSYEFIYRYEEGSDWIKVKHVLIEKDGKVFEIRYSAGINTYEKYVSLAEKCINTFEIL